MSNPELASSRKEYHASMSPAIYSGHARQDLLRDIENLKFPRHGHNGYGTTDVRKLAISPEVKEALAYKDMNAKIWARRDGVSELVIGKGIHRFGYGDRHFSPFFASILGKELSGFLVDKEVIPEELSVIDQAKMFQTGWFGDLANQFALTGPGHLQPYCDGYTQGKFMELFWRLDPKAEVAGPDFKYDDIFSVQDDVETGLHIVTLTDDAKKVLHRSIDRDNSVGCPVARTSFVANKVQVEFLSEYGHLDASGFQEVNERHVKEKDKILLRQDVYTAIDDVMWQWGDYVLRYGVNLLHTQHPRPEQILPTRAGETLLLD